MQFGFVDEETSKWSERSIIAFRALFLALNPCLRGNICQIFRGHAALRAFGFENQVFGNRMVHVFLKTGLLACQFLQFTSRRVGQLFLQITTQALMLQPIPLHHRAGVSLAAAGRGKVAHTQINA